MKARLEYSRQRIPYGGLRDGGQTVRLISLCLAIGFGSVVPFVIAMSTGKGLVLLLGMIAQPIVVGVGLAKVFKQYDFRRKAVMSGIAFPTGLLATVIFHASLYVRDLYTVAKMYTPASSLNALRFVADGSAAAILARAVPHQLPIGRFPSYVLARIFDKSASSNLTLFHFGAMFFAAFISTKPSINRLRCTKCDSRDVSSSRLLVLPVDIVNELITALKSDDLAAVARLIDTVDGVPLGNSCAVIDDIHCRSCGHHTVQVVVKIWSGLQTAAASKAIQYDVSAEMADVLKMKGIGTQPPTRHEAESIL